MYVYFFRALLFKHFHRFSDVGDSVLVSGGHRDASLTSAALAQGRVSIVLESEAAKLSDTAASLDKVTGSAAKEGMWATMLKVSQPLVTVGPDRLPAVVPVSNVPASTVTEVEALRDAGSEEPEKALAQKSADLHGLVIKVVFLVVFRRLCSKETTLFLLWYVTCCKFCACGTQPPPPEGRLVLTAKWCVRPIFLLSVLTAMSAQFL